MRSMRTADLDNWSTVRYDCFDKRDLRKWFRVHCTGDVFISPSILYFKESKDAVFYKMSSK